MSDRTRTITWDDPMLTAAGATGRTGLAFMQALATGEIPPPPIMALVGARLTAIEHGRAVFECDPDESHYNPIGSVHGGVIATLLDSASGCAVQTTLPEGTGYTSLDLSVKYLRAVRADSGTMTCTGTVVHRGRRTALAHAELATARIGCSRRQQAVA